MHSFGDGRSVYVGFDLLSEIGSGLHNGLLADLLDRTLEHIKPNVTPAPTTFAPGAVVPVTFDVSNIECVPAAGRVTLALPEGVSVVYAGDGATQVDGSLIWTFDLAVNGKSNWTFWLRLPDAAGPVNLHAVIEAGYTPASLQPFREVPLVFDVPTSRTFEGSFSKVVSAATGSELSEALNEVNEGWLAGKLNEAFKGLLDLFGESAEGDEEITPAVEVASPLSWAVRGLAMILPIDIEKKEDNETGDRDGEGDDHE